MKSLQDNDQNERQCHLQHHDFPSISLFPECPHHKKHITPFRMQYCRRLQILIYQSVSSISTGSVLPARGLKPIHSQSSPAFCLFHLTPGSPVFLGLKWNFFSECRHRSWYHLNRIGMICFSSFRTCMFRFLYYGSRRFRISIVISSDCAISPENVFTSFCIDRAISSAGLCR